ncbi:MAG: hypothetical protein J2P21_01225 [Chloracidobacterium sp.]|nr:hypothetical protein [Chloracidobacterium sp.]
MVLTTWPFPAAKRLALWPGIPTPQRRRSFLLGVTFRAQPGSFYPPQQVLTASTMCFGKIVILYHSEYPQSLFMLNKRTRVFDLLAIAGCGQRLNTDIYTDFGSGLFYRSITEYFTSDELTY